jgi:MFS family permease
MDKYFEGREKRLLVGSLMVSGLAIFLMYNADTIVMAFVWNSLAGLGMGMTAPIIYAMVLKNVRKELVGTASGLTAFGTAFSGVVAPTIMGFSISLTAGSYAVAFGMIIVILVMAAVLAATIRTTKVPVESTEPVKA